MKLPAWFREAFPEEYPLLGAPAEAAIDNSDVDIELLRDAVYVVLDRVDLQDIAMSEIVRLASQEMDDADLSAHVGLVRQHVAQYMDELEDGNSTD